MQFHPKILNFRDKSNAYTNQNECFYTLKTILLYKKAMFLVSVLNLFSLPTMSL